MVMPVAATDKPTSLWFVYQDCISHERNNSWEYSHLVAGLLCGHQGPWILSTSWFYSPWGLWSPLHLAAE